jgi:hypothetical protein
MPYRLYGLAVDSTLPLSCPRVSVRRRPDVRLRPASAAHFARARRVSGLSSTPNEWFEYRVLPTGGRYLRWAGLFEFLVSSDARRIEYLRLGTATPESFKAYLLGQVLSFSLLSRGYEPLHATAVVIDGHAIAFLGDCGYGKSTLGAAFVARGFPMLTDDMLALEPRDGRWLAHGGPPRLKLFPSIARRVLARQNGSRLNPGTAKVVLPLTSSQATNRALPLRAVYVLPDPDSGRRAPTRIRIARVAPQQAFVEVIRSAFNLIQVDRTRLENQFATATRLANEVPVRRLAYPRRLSSLNAVCEAVVADAAALSR